jgi:hypothetical protein
MIFYKLKASLRPVILSAAKDLRSPDDSCANAGDPSLRSG